QPRGQVLIAISGIFVEDDNHSSYFTGDFVELPHVNVSMVMPIANGFPQVDSIQDGGGERLSPHPLLGKHALGLLFEKAAVIFDHHVLGWIGANRISIRLPGPLAISLL